MKLILATKLKNQFRKEGNYECYLKNIIINGSKRGCSGFVRNPENNRIAYLTTESSCYGPLREKVMYRTAEHLKDYTGGRNQWCKPEELVQNVIDLIK